MNQAQQAPVMLITGGGRGVGAAAYGCDVAISFVSDASAAHGVVAEVTSTGHRALAVRADNARPEEVAALFSCIDQEFARTDVLVNNAAIIAHQCQVEDAGFIAFAAIFVVNSIGPMFCAQQAIKRMSYRHRGEVAR